MPPLVHLWKSYKITTIKKQKLYIILRNDIDNKNLRYNN